MRGASFEETIMAKEAYECLACTHVARFCVYRAEKGSFTEPLFKEEVKTCGQYTSYCRMGSQHQNAIVEHRIKYFTLVSKNLLLHVTRLCP